MNSAIYTGQLTHARWHPVIHRFRYPIFMMLLDLDELEPLSRALRLFSYNRRNVLAIHDRDYQDTKEQSIGESIRTLVVSRGHPRPARICALTHARIFGYVFNPVSFFYALDDQGRVQCVVAEVNNTFGDTHRYVLDSETQTRSEPLEFRCPKLMHVSPFFSLMGQYKFRFPSIPTQEPDSPLNVEMDYLDEGVHNFTANLSLRRTPLTNTTLALTLLRYPWMTVQVMGLIHWEALKLLWKKTPRHSCPTYDPESVLETHRRFQSAREHSGFLDAQNTTVSPFTHAPCAEELALRTSHHSISRG